jgi:hypothetical protein
MRSMGVREGDTPQSAGASDVGSLASAMMRNMSSLALNQPSRVVDDSDAGLYSKMEGPPVLVADAMAAKDLVGAVLYASEC